jgi:hypothetical protein
MSRMKWPTEADIRQLFAVVNTRNVDRVLEQYAVGASFQLPELDCALVGKPAIRAFLAAKYTTYPNWSQSVTKVLLSGDEAAVVSSLRGTRAGPSTGPDGARFSPTDTPLAREHLTWVVFDGDGKVASLRAYGEPAPLDDPPVFST